MSIRIGRLSIKTNVLVAVVAAVAVVAQLVSPVATVGAAPQIEDQTVIPGDFGPDGWFYYNDNTKTALTGETSAHSIADRPGGTYTLDSGAVRLESAAGDRWSLATHSYSDIALADIEQMLFGVYTSAPGKADVTFDIDFNHPSLSGWQNRLVFEPAAGVNSWTPVDATSGSWKWSEMISGAATAWPDGVADAERSWSDIVAAFPGARIMNEDFGKGGVYFSADGPGVTYYDYVRIATATQDVEYNFEKTTDRVAPVVTVTDAVVNADKTVTITGTTDEHSYIFVAVDGTLEGGVEAGSALPWSVTVGPLTVGQHTITIHGFDMFGNENVPTSHTITVSADDEEEVVTGGTTPEIPVPTAPRDDTPAVTAEPAVVTTYVAPAATDEADAPEVLGSQTDRDSDKEGETGAASTDEEKPAAEAWKLLGLQWYWWLLIGAAIGGLWWLFGARRQGRDAE